MRKKLKKLGSKERFKFTATVGRYGFKNGWRHHLPKRTILLTDVCYNSEVVTSHVWLVCGKRINELYLQVGEKIEFEARVKRYTKHNEMIYELQEVDYCLSYPSKIRRIS